MPRQVEKQTDLYTIEWDEDLETVIFTWEDFASGERFREGGNDMLEFIRSKDASKLIVDTSGIRAHHDEDMQWIDEVLVPKLIDAGIEYASHVHKDSVIAEMDMESLLTQLNRHPYTVHIAGSVAEAREWIADPEEPEALQ